jgi:dTDP-4-dehydrorhamnose reductase
MKILITGAVGQLGSELQRIIEEGRAEIGPIPSAYAGAEVVPTDAAELDITDASAVEAEIAKGYDLVVNAAAYTDVDGCEARPGLAWAVNAQGPANLANACRAHGTKLVQVSTDYVFPGSDGSRPRREDDPTAPISAYGRSKRAGELAVELLCPESFIVRTAWLYGYVGKNFVKTMRRLGASHDRITVVDDQVGNPTSANDLAYEILTLAAGEGFGTYHCTNEGVCSWADFASAIMEGFGLNCTVVPVTSAQYKEANPASADRPAYSALENTHLAATVGNRMRPWREALTTYINNFDSLEG